MKAEYVDSMGNDLSVVNAARVSFGKVKAELDEGDRKLIHYLAKHDHWTPFAHTAITLRMQAPIPIRTQCFKHKIGLVENEESRRYVSTTPEFFHPEWRSKPEGSIKQGSGGIHPQNTQLASYYDQHCKVALDVYQSLIALQVCPEQARLVLPQGTEVNWVWTGNLMAFANFYLKRIDTHAQKEIQILAQMVDELIEPLYPVSWAALTGESNGKPNPRGTHQRDLDLVVGDKEV